MLRTDAEKARGYSDATHELILEIERVDLRQEYVFDVPEITRILTECYRLCDLPMPRVKTAKDVCNKKFKARATWTAGKAGLARMAWGKAEVARMAWGASAGARMAWGAAGEAAGAAGGFGGAARWSAGVAAQVARVMRMAWAAIDYDFDHFIMEHEFLQHNKGNANDRKALRLYSLFFEAKKAGLGYFAERDGVLVIVPNPILKIDDRNRFHCDSGPAIWWEGGAEYYFLHGVRMPDYFVLTPPNEIDPERIWKLKSADQRAQAISKIGVGRLLDGPTAQVLDGMGEYTLHEITIRTNVRLRVLKMRNPSERWKWHVEAVPLECSTVREARHARKPPVLRAIPVSEDGEEWYQQGDLCIWPEGAKSVRESPSLLT